MTSGSSLESERERERGGERKVREMDHRLSQRKNKQNLREKHMGTKTQDRDERGRKKEREREVEKERWRHTERD